MDNKLQRWKNFAARHFYLAIGRNFRSGDIGEISSLNKSTNIRYPNVLLSRFDSFILNCILNYSARSYASLWSALWRCSRVRRKWTNLDEVWSTLSTLSGADNGRIWARFGEIWRLESDAKFCFLSGSTDDFTDLLSAKFHEIWTPCRPVRRWILLEQNFEAFPVRGRFSKRRKNRHIFNVLQLQAAITPQ